MPERTKGQSKRALAQSKKEQAWEMGQSKRALAQSKMALAQSRKEQAWEMGQSRKTTSRMAWMSWPGRSSCWRCPTMGSRA